MKFIIYTDGGSRSNPGQAAAAFIIQNKESDILAQEGKYLGVATNNEAEYQAVYLALEKLKQDFTSKLPAEVEVKSDSRLIVQQLCGQFKIKNSKLKILYEEIKKLEDMIGKIQYVYIPRSQNFLADNLVNIILDNQAR